jgi:hypothetical protein
MSREPKYTKRTSVLGLNTGKYMLIVQGKEVCQVTKTELTDLLASGVHALSFAVTQASKRQLWNGHWSQGK